MAHVTMIAAIVAALLAFMPAAVAAQAHGDHLMVVPSDLKWGDVPSLPPGAKIAVM